jgi:hypothetical protein
VDDGLRLERQVVAHPAGDVDQGHPKEFKQQEDGGVDCEQPGDRTCERRQAERHFSTSCHDWLRCYLQIFLSSSIGLQLILSHLSGWGTTGGLRCPALSSARTANITLSFDSGSVMRLTFPTDFECSHSGLAVSRHTTS